MLKKTAAVILASLSALMAFSAPKVTMTDPASQKKQYDTIQSALNAIKGEGEYTILLPEGTYEEVLYYKGPATVILSGQTKSKFGSNVVIAKDNDGDLGRIKIAGTAQKNRCLFEFDGTGNLILENLTLHNTYVRGTVKGSGTQAETLGFDSTGYVAAYNCSFKSHQDTLRTTGKTWFYKCYVEGDTDFIWMEATGKTALFEECTIYSVYDEKHAAHTSYIGAPRMNIGPKAHKGLVIFNSTVSSDKRQTTYLGRTPWSSGYYSQIAFVKTKASGVTKELWSKTPLTSPGVPENIIGWKLDSTTAKSLGVSTEGRKDIIPEKDVSLEFSGRDAILNRHYDILAGKYRKDSEGIFDASAVASSRKWKISTDKSSSLLKGETEPEQEIFFLDGTNDTGLSKVKFDGFAKEADKPHYAGNPGAKITIPLAKKGIVTVTGYYAGTGTIKAGTQGEGTYNFCTGTTSTYADSIYVVYEDKAELTLTAEEKSYITKISVLYDNDLKFRPVESIEVKSHRNKTELAGRKTLQMSAILNPPNPTNPEYIWSVSDENAAVIDSNGFLKANAVKEDTIIKVMAKSRDAKGAYGEKEIKILKPEEGAFSVTWLDTPASTETLAGTSDNDKVGIAQKAVPSAGTWKFNSSKISSDVAKAALSYSDYTSELIGRKTVYIDFPITAREKFQLTEVSVAYGNHGTGNIACHVTYINGDKSGSIFDDDSRKIRNAKSTYKVNSPVIAEKGETITVRVALYGLSGAGDIPIPTGKAPTIATVTINGKQIK